MNLIYAGKMNQNCKEKKKLMGLLRPLLVLTLGIKKFNTLSRDN